MRISYLFIVALLFGCETNKPLKIEPVEESQPILTPWGSQIGDFKESALWKVTQIGFNRGKNILDSKGKPLHYKMEKIEGPSNQVFILHYTYLDDEDGGNSYGWVEDGKGNKVGTIDDCFLNKL